MNEEFTLCSSCGKQTPKYQFCIYCGYNLRKDRGKRIQAPEEERLTLESQETMKSIESESLNFSELPGETIMSPFPTALAMGLTLDDQIAQARRELLNYQIWRIKLCTILSEQGTSTQVFTNIWDDYGKEVVRIQKMIAETLGARETSYKDKRVELENAKLKLEELRVRVAIGEISESDLLIRTPSIRADIESLEFEASRFSKQQGGEEAIHGGWLPREMLDYEQSARTLMYEIHSLVTEGKLSTELGGRLEEEIGEIQSYFSSMIGTQGGQDIRNELDTLEVRYKVGEITLDEFESLKRDLVSSL
ncbi:MAG: SHOCT domain-containing protein [Candidatus Bathyarchaeota archaeon]|jgi:hypothetical protein|nr:SHOCT domain-containing protein [Candidatus Bathyarchaeota archaeon]MDP7207383.1 SHOCT domain-containing protein [Candidatus Bathyarchaeota archaeon]